MKKKKALSFIVIAIFFAYIITLGTGYALSRRTLEVQGTASTNDYYSGNDLPGRLVELDATNHRYFIASDTKPYLNYSWQNDTESSYNIHFNKVPGISAGQKTITYTISFINPTVLTYTNGNATCAIVQNVSGAINSCSINTIPTTLNSNAATTINLTITHNFVNNYGYDIVQGTINYTFMGSSKSYLYKVYFDQY